MSRHRSLARRSAALTLLGVLALAWSAHAADADLLPEGADGYEAFNRTVTVDGGVTHMNNGKGDGLAWLPGKEFSTGTITIEVRGLDQPQRSFVGFAFHGRDNETFDAVYVRPFNFNAADPVRKSHAIQYISMPANSWPVLREKFPGKYESALTPPPPAEEWVRLRLEVEAKQLRVFVNDASAPALTIELLNDRLNGRVGLWVGNNSAGWFRNLAMTSRK